MKYLIEPTAKFIACVLMAQVAAFAYCFVLVWSLSHKSAKREAGVTWSMRYLPEGFFVMVVYVMAMLVITPWGQAIKTIINESR